MSCQPAAKPGPGKGYLSRYLPFLARPPVLPTQSADGYWVLMAELFNELKPASVLEAHYIEDVVYNSWQIRRLRRVQADLVSQAMIDIGNEELADVLHLSTLSCFAEYDSESKAWSAAKVMMVKAMAGDTAVASAIETFLVDFAGLSWEDLHARAIDQVMTSYGRLEQMIHLCERQRQDVFKDFVFLGQAKAVLLEQRSNETVTGSSVRVIPETVESEPAADAAPISGIPGASIAAGEAGTGEASGKTSRARQAGRAFPGSPDGIAASVLVATARSSLANTAAANTAAVNTAASGPA